VATQTALPAAPAVSPDTPPPARKKRGDWQTIAALIIFPIPVALWAGFFALVFGVVDLPPVISRGCTVDCLTLQEDVRATYTDPRACDGTGRRICFVPMGSFPREDIERLQVYYRVRYGIEVNVLPGIDLEASVLDNEYEEAFAPQLLQRILTLYPALAGDPNKSLIGLTTVDIYGNADTAGRLDFWMAYVAPGLNGGIVSTADMHPEIFGVKLEGDEGELRLQKAVNRVVGFVHFRLPQSSNPRDLTYWGTTTPWMLDKMPADLPIPQPR
jgi:hypothetical protein